MSDHVHATVIDGYKYEMTLLGAKQGYRLFHRIIRAVGPSIGHFLGALDSGDSIQDVDLSSDGFAAGLQSLTSGVKEAELDHLIAELAKQTQVAVQPGDEKTVPLTSVFDLHFRGRLGTMFKWLGWGLKVQFSDFFDAFAEMRLPSGGDDNPVAAMNQ